MKRPDFTPRRMSMLARSEKEAVCTAERLSAMIAKGLGGADNIADVDCCATRLRVTVKDADKVEESTLKQSGAAGVIKKGKGRAGHLRTACIRHQIRSGRVSARSEGGLKDRRSWWNRKRSRKRNRRSAKCSTAPIQGEAKLISETPDATFAQKMMGDGIVIFPQDGTLYAPCDATVSFVFDTKHAIGLVSKEGVEMLIHVGIDTVQRAVRASRYSSKTDKQSKRVQTAMEIDLQYIREHAPVGCDRTGIHQSGRSPSGAAEAR